MTSDRPPDAARADAALLEAALSEIEAHVHAAGWDRSPALFALVRAGRFASDDPEAAARLGLDAQLADALTPIEQGELPDEPVDQMLAGIAWPDGVEGCALAQEIVILPPSADAELADATPEQAAAHPDRREARLVVGVLAGGPGASAALLRLRARGPADGNAGPDAGADAGADGDLLTGPDLAPNLVEALRATLR